MTGNSNWPAANGLILMFCLLIGLIGMQPHHAMHPYTYKASDTGELTQSGCNGLRIMVGMNTVEMTTNHQYASLDNPIV